MGILDSPYSVFALKTEFNVRIYGAKFDGVTDDTAAIQAAINACSAAGGGVVVCPPGKAIVNGGLTWPTNKIIALRGQGSSASGNIFGTSLSRTAAGNPIISAVGTGPNTSERVLPQLFSISFNGGGFSQPVVTIQRASRIKLDDIRISNNIGGSGIELIEVWDSDIGEVYVQQCGSGTTTPAVLIGAVQGNATAAVSDGIHFKKLSIHSSYGTDLRITGDKVLAAPSSNIQILNLNMEGTGAGTSGTPDTYPYIDLDYAQDCSFANVRVSMPTGRACTAVIQQTGASAGPRANQFANTVLDVAGTNAPTRYVDWSVGALQFVNLIIPSSQPTSEYFRVTGSANRFRIKNLIHNSPNPTSGFITDSRTTAEDMSLGRIPITGLVADGATLTTVGDNTAWSFPAGSDTFVRAQVVMPKDIDTAGKVYLRAYWAAASTGNAQLAWVQRTMTAGSSLVTTAGTSVEQNINEPVANQLVNTGWTGANGLAVTAGQLVTIKFGRKGTNGADTIANPLLLVGLELSYNKQL